MKIDYTDFIVKHHKAMQPAAIEPSKPRRYGGVLSVVSVSLVIVIFMITAIITVKLIG